MKLAKLLKNVCFTGDYIDVVNLNVEPPEKIRVDGEMLKEIYDKVFYSVPYSRSWTLVQYLQKSENRKLAEWLDNEIDNIDMNNRRIFLYEGVMIGE